MEKLDSVAFQNYKIISLIGNGSFGKVFKATELDTQNVVALKVLNKVN
jgi:serine/threonine protein kinase